MNARRNLARQWLIFSLFALVFTASVPLQAASLSAPPQGIYVSSAIAQPDAATSIQREDMAMDFVSGVLVRVFWSDVEKEPGVYDFSVIDNELALAEKYNTKIALAVLNGQSAPLWLYREGVPYVGYADTSDGNYRRIPLPWNEQYLERWKSFVAALGERYNTHPRIVLVHVTHATDNGFEMHMPFDTELEKPWVEHGYNESLMIDSWKEVIDAFAYAFPDKPLDVEVHPVLRSDAVANEVYGYVQSAYPAQVGVFAAWWSQKNALQAYPGMFELMKRGAAGSFATAQLVCSWTREPNRMGEGGIQTAVELALQNGVRYLEVWNQDIRNPELADFWRQTAKTLNTLNEAPQIGTIADQTLDEDAKPLQLAFTVSDKETAAADLTVTASSSDSLLLPAASLVLGGTGEARTLSVTPAANASGSTQITLFVSDGSQTASSTFRVTVNPVNDLPAISALTDVTISEDTSTTALSFTVSDVETDMASLTVTAGSDNTTLLPPSAFALASTTRARSLKITPAADQNGSARVTVSVSDGKDVATTSFQLMVMPVNDGPAMSALSELSVREDGGTVSQAFTVSDPDTDPATLAVSASTSNSGLVSASGIAFGGSGDSRTVSVTPAANKSGSATITINVSDGSATAKSSFAVTVQDVNDAPVISGVTNFSISEDTASTSKSFTISDTDDAVDTLLLKAVSDNQALVPDTGLQLGGSGGSRSIKVTPAAEQSGSATITLTVSDAAATASSSFTVSVTAVDDLPVLASLPAVSIPKNSTGYSVPLSLADNDTDVEELAVTVTTSNSRLLPVNQISVQGSGAERSLWIVPGNNRTGSATVTVKVADRSGSISGKFTVTVQ